MDKILIKPAEYTTLRLVKSEDLNHHGTLFAGRTAEWFVESGFIAASSMLDPKSVVCLKIHGMHFSKPARAGQVVGLVSKIVYTGKSSVVANVKIRLNGETVNIVDGFITFIHVDESTKPKAHNIEIVPESQEDKELYEIAKNLKNR
ncbi:MAG TPA: hotdog domain-containing protein [Bacteroidales bacterium]|nr:hotdog domain-containing protein [Bacteroidales bacterium]